MLWCIAAGIVAQGAFAGLFLSGNGGARVAHLIGGVALPYIGIAVAIVAIVHHRRATIPPRVAIATYALPVLLWVQEVLGHVPAAATTAVHVPLGVTLAVYTTALAVAAGSRRGTTVA